MVTFVNDQGKSPSHTYLDLIGNTPLVEIKKLNPNKKVKILAKLEKFNPTGSIKDRTALYLITEAEKDGKLSRGTTIIEPTSGNTGIALAMIASAKGYNLKIVMPENMTIERRKMITSYGAELILTPAKEGMDGAIRIAEEISKHKGYFMPNQFNNEANVNAHYETTGTEIWAQTDGQVTHIVAGIGTSGTLMGVSKRLKQHNPNVKVIGVEPRPSGKISGLKNLDSKIIPKIFDPKMLDKVVKIDDRDAFRTAKELAKKEGLFVGASSGAAMHVALETAKQLEKGTVVVIFPDGGEKYISEMMAQDNRKVNNLNSRSLRN